MNLLSFCDTFDLNKLTITLKCFFHIYVKLFRGVIIVSKVWKIIKDSFFFLFFQKSKIFAIIINGLVVNDSYFFSNDKDQ